MINLPPLSFYYNFTSLYLHILYKQLFFRVEHRVAIKMPEMKLKVAMKLLIIFGIEALTCYEVANYFWNRGSRLPNFSIISGSNVRKTSKNWQKRSRLLRLSDKRLKSC